MALLRLDVMAELILLLQIGTVNYMSPEAIEIPDGMRRLKVGRASDIWSLGCILYQMVYGQPPFQHLSMYQKMKAIPDGSYEIDFPEFSTPSIPRAGSSSPPKKLDHLKVPVPRTVIDTVKSCLTRYPKERATIPQLLSRDWLALGEGRYRDIRPDKFVLNWNRFFSFRRRASPSAAAASCACPQA